jgi:hypothetical protein
MAAGQAAAILVRMGPIMKPSPDVCAEPDPDVRTDPEQVLSHARRLIASGQRSLAQGTELIRQCRDIIRSAKPPAPAHYEETVPSPSLVPSIARSRGARRSRKRKR